MKDRLEDFVRSHQNEFDVFDPSDELWAGIEKKMEKGKKHTFTFYLSRIAAVAAIFILSFTIQQYFWGTEKQVVIPELQEAEVYYTGLLNMKMEQVKPMLDQHPGLEEGLNTDLSELDSIYEGLKKDLNDNIANQEVIEAMIENYRLRISILEDLVMYLDEDSSDNNNNNSEYEL